MIDAFPREACGGSKCLFNIFFKNHLCSREELLSTCGSWPKERDVELDL